MNKIVEEHSFSIEMKTEDAVKKMSFLDKENGQVFFEGCLGKLTNINMVEGVMLEIEGVNGILKLDITQKEIEACITPKKPIQIGGEQSMKRQQTRKLLIVLMFVLFPVIYYYFSPYLIIMGASEGIVTGSLLVFAALFVSSLFLGRVFCGWICPAGATQELCAMVRKKGFKNGKKNLIKYAIWAPWITIIALMFFQAGGVKSVDPLYQTYYGISISDIYSLVIFVA